MSGTFRMKVWKVGTFIGLILVAIVFYTRNKWEPPLKEKMAESFIETLPKGTKPNEVDHLKIISKENKQLITKLNQGYEDEKIPKRVVVLTVKDVNLKRVAPYIAKRLGFNPRNDQTIIILYTINDGKRNVWLQVGYELYGTVGNKAANILKVTGDQLVSTKQSDFNQGLKDTIIYSALLFKGINEKDNNPVLKNYVEPQAKSIDDLDAEKESVQRLSPEVRKYRESILEKSKNITIDYFPGEKDEPDYSILFIILKFISVVLIYFFFRFLYFLNCHLEQGFPYKKYSDIIIHDIDSVIMNWWRTYD